MGDPRALLSSYSTVESMEGSNEDEAKVKLIAHILETVEILFSAFHQVITIYILKNKSADYTIFFDSLLFRWTKTIYGLIYFIYC